MIELSMELPTVYLDRWTSDTDIDFALAHKVLEDPRYAEFYAKRSRGRECILDNSVHELKEPLLVSDLHKAAQMIRADYVVAPDRLKHVEQNLKWFMETDRVMGHEFKIAVVLCGRTQEELHRFLAETRHASMLCLPFRENRFTWWQANKGVIREHYSRIHLLGVNELSELQAFRRISDRDHGATWSVDTAKAVKWGAKLRSIDDGRSLRECDISSRDLLNLFGLSQTQLRIIDHNVDVLRRICSA